MKNIYLVYGKTGEYADRVEWVVGAFTTKRKASIHAKRAQGFSDKQTWQNWNPNANPNPFDFDMRLDYTGTNYFVGKIKLY